MGRGAWIGGGLLVLGAFIWMLGLVNLFGQVAANGFAIADVDTMYLPKTPRFAGWNEWGSARPA